MGVGAPPKIPFTMRALILAPLAWLGIGDTTNSALQPNQSGGASPPEDLEFPHSEYDDGPCTYTTDEGGYYLERQTKLGS